MKAKRKHVFSDEKENLKALVRDTKVPIVVKGKLLIDRWFKV